MVRLKPLEVKTHESHVRRRETRFYALMKLSSRCQVWRKPGSAHHNLHPNSEAWRCCRSVFLWQGLENREEEKLNKNIQRYLLMKTWRRTLKLSFWAEGSQQDNDSKHIASGLGTQWMTFSGPDLNPIKHLWRNLEMTFHRRPPSNMIRVGEDLQRRMVENYQTEIPAEAAQLRKFVTNLLFCHVQCGLM